MLRRPEAGVEAAGDGMETDAAKVNGEIQRTGSISSSRGWRMLQKQKDPGRKRDLGR